MVLDCVKRILKVKKNNSVSVTYNSIKGLTNGCL